MTILYQDGAFHVFLKYLDFSALRFREPHSKSVNLVSVKSGLGVEDAISYLFYKKPFGSCSKRLFHCLRPFGLRGGFKMARREQAKIVVEDFCKKGREQIHEAPDMAQVSALLAAETMTREDWELNGAKCVGRICPYRLAEG
ncbi:hypothetical protein L0337_11085 [candidate division KSB1 bacterium]|nr:hypothetical protein [candidate division KSB1 bacterium]